MGFEEFTVNLPGIGTGKWVVDGSQRKAAWEMYVELVTRISVQPLAADEGLLREALTSLYRLFGETRRILREYGPEVAKPAKKKAYSFGQIAVDVLNVWLRPFLSRWHPRLADHEQRRPPGTPAFEHEQKWDDAPTVRAELHELQCRLTVYADLLASACDIAPLHASRT